MPRPDWNEFASLNGFRGVLDPRDTDGRKNQLLDRIHWTALKSLIGRGKHVLDFGCGIGRFASRINALGVSYTGVDTSPMMMETAAKKNPGLTFVHVGAPPFPFAQGAFDCILTCSVFQYIVNTPQAAPLVAEFSRLLAPNGRVLLLEQASGSGQSSETVERTATESDYLSAFSEAFAIKQVARVRLGQLRLLSKLAIRAPTVARPLFRIALDFLSRREISYVQRLTDVELANVRYHDFLMEAIRR